MTLGRSLGRRCVVAAMLHASMAQAGVWTTDPTLGLSGEYSSNPALLNIAHAAETHGAILINTPTTYSADALKFFVAPSLRISNSTGYSSIASDYAHLTFGGEVDSERNSLAFSGQVSRDSSLYSYSVNGSVGVRRDTTGADATWTRSLTEKLKFSFEVSPSRVLYGDSVGLNTLTDYRYTSAAPNLVWDASERTTVTAAASLGLYDSINGRTKSSNSQIELGFSRKLSELWTFAGKGGYSKETNRIDEYVGPFFLGTFKSSNTGTVFNATLSRQGERLGVSAVASRSVVPTGFAFLARQDSYQFIFDYPYTQRWTLDGHVRWLKSLEPQAFGPTVSQSYLDAGVSAAWLLSEHWTFNVGASHVSAKYAPPPTSVAASGVTVQFVRKFNSVVWH